MNTVFMQNDVDWVESFLWSENLAMLSNVILTLNGELESYGREDALDEYCLSYQTKDHALIYEILSVAFDKVIVMNSEEAVSDNFILACKEILNGK